MTRTRLRRRLTAVIGILVLLGTAAILLKGHAIPGLSERQENRWYGVGKDLFPLVVAILATFLASWFQQRATFLESLRRLWTHLIQAKVDLKDYVQRSDHSEPRYGRAYRALSLAIDEMRGVYKNVGEDDNNVGRFPYEPLHDMRKALEELGWGDEKCNEAALAKAEAAIDQAWNSLRLKFLAEFDPPEPTDPITEHFSKDPRRTSEPVS